MKCKCIKCDKSLTNLANVGMQPDNGLACVTYGHYGSTYFDPMDGSYLEFTICDTCIKELVDKGYVYEGKHHNDKF